MISVHAVATEAYQWRTFAFVPVELDADFWPALEADEQWMPWHASMSEAELRDVRNFFVSEVASVLCPDAVGHKDHGRWLCKQLDAGRPVTVLAARPEIRLGGVQLIRFPWLSAFIIEIFSTQPLDREALLDTNRQVVRWIGKGMGDQLPLWRDEAGNTTTLAQWLVSLLPGSQRPKLLKAFKRLDWFGHYLSSFSVVRYLHQSGQVRADDLTVGFLSGIPANEKGYRLAPAVSESMMKNCVDQYWDNWFFSAHEGRYLASLSADTAGFIERNLACYYMPMILLVIYQKLRAAQLLKQFHRCGLEENRRGLANVRWQFTQFRHKFAFQYVTHFPLGNRIFSFAYRLADIDGNLLRIADQIESVDNYEQLQIEKREAKTMILLTWMAALVLPLTTVAAIFSVDRQFLSRFYPFWLVALAATLVMLLVVFLFQRRNRSFKQGTQ